MSLFFLFVLCRPLLSPSLPANHKGRYAEEAEAYQQVTSEQSIIPSTKRMKRTDWPIQDLIECFSTLSFSFFEMSARTFFSACILKRFCV